MSTLSTSVGSAASSSGGGSRHSMPRSSQAGERGGERGGGDFRGVPRVAMATPTSIANLSTTPSSTRQNNNNVNHHVTTSNNHHGNHNNKVSGNHHHHPSNGSMASFHLNDRLQEGRHNESRQLHSDDDHVTSLALDLINATAAPPHSSHGRQQQHLQQQQHHNVGGGHSRGASHGGISSGSDGDRMPPPPPLLSNGLLGNGNVDYGAIGVHPRSTNGEGGRQQQQHYSNHQRQHSQPRQFYDGQDGDGLVGGGGRGHVNGFDMTMGRGRTNE